jgi:nicotinamidase-related amidase
MANKALLVIDAQKIYTEKDGALACKDASRTLAKINKLISRFADMRLPIIYIRHQHKKDGSDTGRLFDYEAEGEGEEEFNFVEGTDEVQYAPKLELAEQRHEIVKNRLACPQFRRHRVRCFDGTGGGSWRDEGLRGSSSLRRYG